MDANTPIQIDLRDLTNTEINACLPYHGKKCEYAAPCIIGTLIPTDKRPEMDSAPFDDTTIGTLIEEGLIVLPASQRRFAKDLQRAFDDSAMTDDDFLKVVARILADLEQVSA